jgi:hypothetical protein
MHVSDETTDRGDWRKITCCANKLGQGQEEEDLGLKIDTSLYTSLMSAP